MVPSLLAEEVRAQVHRFWNAYTSKAGDVMQSMYVPAATVFSSSGPHSETARLTLARRVRQFAEEKSSRSAEVGTIDVRIMDDVAVASYPYEFRLSEPTPDGGQVEINVPFSGATQVFWRDKGGVLRIVHEHFSAAEPGKKTQVARPAMSGKEPATGRPSASGAASNLSGAASLPATDSTFAEQIRSEVKKLWQHYKSKSKEALERMYSPTAIAWSIGAKRGLPVRLVLAAKAREVLGPQSSLDANLGAIDVHTLSKNVAVASYSFHYRIVMVQRYGKRVDIDVPFQGKRYSVDCPSTRGTQVFERDETGALQIVHEHVSTSGVPIYMELPVADSETVATR
jgi:ketosteroid isomerase-like protein